MIYLETKSTDPAYNLAFEEWVLTHLHKGEYLILWQNDNTVVIGQNQNTPEEINTDFVREHNIQVVRRTTGGGAVYHDLGNLNYSFITDYDREAGTDMSKFTGIVVRALGEMGLDASASGRNDIIVDGKKVSGTAQRIVKVRKEDGNSVERILYHGTLLFKSDPEMIAGALHADPLKFASKSTKSVRSRVGNISDYLPNDMKLEDFWEKLRETLTKEGEKNAAGDAPAVIDEKAVRELKETKYDTWEWNYGRSPKTDFVNRKRFAGGTLDVRLAIEKGCIADAAIYGDFLSLKPASVLAESLRGIPYTEEAVKTALSAYKAGDYLGTITEQELINTVLGTDSES